jgi:hypothetical protein
MENNYKLMISFDNQIEKEAILNQKPDNSLILSTSISFNEHFDNFEYIFVQSKLQALNIIGINDDNVLVYPKSPILSYNKLSKQKLAEIKPFILN